MAIYSTRTVGAVTLSASATKSLWLLNPVADFFVVAQFAVSFKTTTASDTVAVELYRVTTIGTPAGTTGTQVKINRVADAAAPTTTSLVNLTAEPTAVEILADWEIQPYGGALDIQYPLQREPIAAAAGQRLGLRVVTPAAVTPGVRSYVWYDER